MKRQKSIAGLKTIDIQAKEWFDKVNGNSYFSAIISLNYGMEDARQILLPFQYGYGSHYIDMAKEELVKQGIIKADKNDALWRYCEDHKIILRTSKHENCKKRDVVAYGL